jgi:hypothetical protein
MKNLRSFTIAVGCAAALTVACGAKTSGGGGTPTPASACDDYFQALLTDCPNDGFVSLNAPQSDIDHVHDRWTTLCSALLQLPGSSITASTLETCVSALKSSGCASIETESGACAFETPGTLPAGSACQIGEQCETSHCTTTTTPSSDGGEVTCGTCEPTAPIGGSCTSQPCGTNAACENGICVAINYAPAGASCGVGSIALCTPGYFCNPTSNTCTVAGGAGAPCTDPTACLEPLTCTLAPGSTSGVCSAPAQAGAKCNGEVENTCALGLTCEPSTSTCVTVTVAAPGEACNGDTIQCQTGECNTATGTCPTVIADGQPCSGGQSTTCDVFSNCEEGTCVFPIGACH